jgi:hypothetical protein
MAKIKHVVMIKFKEGTAQEQIDKVFDDLMDLSENVDGIEDYVSGPNISNEALNQGYTHAFVMTFQDIAARDAYVPHAEHERVKAALLPLLDSIAVIDFEV